MSKRTDRREAERLARKAAYQLRLAPNPAAARDPQPSLEPAVAPEATAATPTRADLLARAQAFFDHPERTASPTQIAANQANAQLSTGPITPEGKAISARNHTTHGLTAQVTSSPFQVLRTENQSDYDRSLAGYQKEWKPTTETELDLVRRLATHAWLRDRAQRLQDNHLSFGLADAQAYKQFEILGRYYALHLRAYNKTLADLMRLRSFQMRQRNSEVLLERRAQDTQFRFESQKRKAEEHAAKMETLRLKQEGQKQRNSRLKPAEPAALQAVSA